MQPTVLTNLLGLGSAPSAGGAGVTAASILGDEAGGGQSFAQLLGDTGFQMGGDPQQQYQGGQLLSPSVLGALSAQDLSGQLPDSAPETQDLSGILIAPEDVAPILARIELALRQDGQNALDTETLGKLKAQLQQQAQGGEVKSVEQIIRSVVAVRDSVSQSAIVKLLAPRKLETSADQEAQEGPNSVAAMWQNVQAGMFRANRREDSPAPSAARSETQEEPEEIATVTVIEPLSASLTLELPMSPTAVEAVTTAALPPSDIDSIIPPLSAGLAKDSQVLPDVDLPQMQLTPSPVRSPEIPLNTADIASENVVQSKSASALVDNSTAGADLSGGNASFASQLSNQQSQLLSANTANYAQDMNPMPVIAHTPAAHHSQAASVAPTLNLIATPHHLNHAPVTDQVHIAIQQASKDGTDRITIQLDPVDLGRVEVNMQTGRDGLTQIQFMVDKPETFDNLSRDARLLERSLQEAGIKADTGSMQFNLRQQPQQNLQADVNGQGQQQGQSQPQANSEPQAPNGAVTSQVLPSNHYILNIREGVDISA